MNKENLIINKIILDDKIFLKNPDKINNSTMDYGALIRTILDSTGYNSSNGTFSNVVIPRIEKEIHELEGIFNNFVRINDLPNIYKTTHSIVEKLGELIGVIQNTGTDFDKRKLSEINTKLVKYMRYNEDIKLKYDKYNEFIGSISVFKKEFAGFEKATSFNKQIANKLLQRAREIIRDLKPLSLYFSQELKYLQSAVDILVNKIAQNQNTSSNLPKIDFDVALNIFGITKNQLTSDLLKKQYRRLASKLHPDKNPGNNTNEAMSRLNQARELLEGYV